MTGSAIEKPRCRLHPDARVLSARIPCSTERVWVCLVCGARLGRAYDQDDAITVTTEDVLTVAPIASEIEEDENS